jgi:hypothetical protein
MRYEAAIERPTIIYRRFKRSVSDSSLVLAGQIGRPAWTNQSPWRRNGPSATTRALAPPAAHLDVPAAPGTTPTAATTERFCTVPKPEFPVNLGIRLFLKIASTFRTSSFASRHGFEASPQWRLAPILSFVSSKSVPGGVVHKLPVDMREALVASSKALAAWRDITPLARNEFICWVEDAKQAATRQRRIRRTQEELEEGQRRPCCWPGCKHRERTGG